MNYGKTKAFVAGVLVTLIPLGFLWNEKRHLREVLASLELEQSLSLSEETLRRNPRSNAPDETSESASPNTLIAAMRGTEFAGIDFSDLPTDQEGIDEVFTRIFSEVSQTERKRLYALLLDSITPEQAPLLMKSMRLRGRLGVPGHEEYRWTLDRWGDIDGEAASAWAFKIDGDDGYGSTHCTNIVIKAWARNEPEAAMNWLAAQKAIELRNGMREGLLAGIIDFHPNKAQELLNAMDATTTERTQAHQLTASRISRMQGAEELDDWLAALPKDTPDLEDIEKHVTRIHLDHGVAHAVAWAQQEPGRLPEVLNHYVTHSASEPLFEYYATQNGVIDSQVTTALRNAARKWTEDDPDLMGVWLRDHMDSPNYETIASLFVESIREIDPDAAAAWAETISP